MIKKSLWFVVLYIWSWCIFLFKKAKSAGLPIYTGAGLVRFYDPDFDAYGNAVVIPVDEDLDWNKYELCGYFGRESDIAVGRRSLYATDTWGVLKPDDPKIYHEYNSDFLKIVRNNPAKYYRLAGVRKFWKWWVWPLNDPTRFYLALKNK